MKRVKYMISGFTEIFNPETQENEQHTILIEVDYPATEETITKAEKESYNGEYTIEDDGQPDPAETPSQLDVIEAQVTYTAMMTDTLLEV